MLSPPTSSLPFDSDHSFDTPILAERRTLNPVAGKMAHGDNEQRYSMDYEITPSR